MRQRDGLLAVPHVSANSEARVSGEGRGGREGRGGEGGEGGEGRGGEAWKYFIGGTPPNALSAMANSFGIKLGAGGGSVVNKVGTGIIKGAGKVFSWPVAVIATAVDYAYTPEADPEQKEKQSRNIGPDQFSREYGKGKSHGGNGPIA
ncbi:hypothetical protein ACTPOK_30465 [Streptomyces inhibens]|uniref:hypothetical protein n=1 Tax=Streptomyces inhibens TaxID=2293571 RepID=UPI00402AB9C3